MPDSPHRNVSPIGPPVSSAARQALGIFVKHPIPGRVKTRIAAKLGDEPAARLYAAFQRDIVDRFRQLSAQRFLCYSPDTPEARTFFTDLAGDDYRLWPQPDSDLGTRLARFFRDSDRAGTARTVVIGSDSPTLPVSHVEQAFEQLECSECVLGPAPDGGFYLLGQRGAPRPLFEQIEWSGPRVLEQTLARIQACGSKLRLLPVWYDVDTPDDLHLLRGHLSGLAMQGQGGSDCPHTRVCLASGE